jgi:ferrous iron transport protein B
VAVSVILWVLASTGPTVQINKAKSDYAEQIKVASEIKAEQVVLDSLELNYKSQRLEASYAGQFGKLIEPVIRPLGFDWKIGIALLTSMAAREVFVGTMSTIYSVSGSDDDLDSIRNKMMHDKNQQTMKPSYSLASVFSLLIFYAFALQCMSTVAIVKKETGGNKWAIIQFIYLTLLAYGSSWLVFSLMS